MHQGCKKIVLLKYTMLVMQFGLTPEKLAS